MRLRRRGLNRCLLLFPAGDDDENDHRWDQDKHRQYEQDDEELEAADVHASDSSVPATTVSARRWRHWRVCRSAARGDSAETDESATWHPQWAAFGDTHRVVCMDLCGFGSHLPTTESFDRLTNIVAVLDALEIGLAVVVGASMGGQVAQDLAVAHPDRVAGLMLIGSAITGHAWSQSVQDFWAVEGAALVAGDIDGAVEANLAFWVDGPSRQHGNLSDADRQLVRTMQRRAFEIELTHPDAGAELRDAALSNRLDEITVPTSILYGLDDAIDIAQIAESIGAQIAHSTLHPIADAAHVPSLEQPETVNRLLAALLAECS